MSDSPPDIVWNAADKRAYREGQLRAYVDNTSPTAREKDIFKRDTIVLSEAYLQGRDNYAKQIPPKLNWVEFAHEHAEYAIFGPGTGSGPEGDLPPAVVVYIEAMTRELEHYALRAAFAEERVAKLQEWVLAQRATYAHLKELVNISDAEKAAIVTYTLLAKEAAVAARRAELAKEKAVAEASEVAFPSLFAVLDAATDSNT